MWTAASAESLIASMKMEGRNLLMMMRTLGPTSLSARILAHNSAVETLTAGLVALQNRSNR